MRHLLFPFQIGHIHHEKRHMVVLSCYVQNHVTKRVQIGKAQQACVGSDKNVQATFQRVRGGGIQFRHPDHCRHQIHVQTGCGYFQPIAFRYINVSRLKVGVSSGPGLPLAMTFGRAEAEGLPSGFCLNCTGRNGAGGVGVSVIHDRYLKRRSELFIERASSASVY